VLQLDPRPVRECPDCGLYQRLSSAGAGWLVRCARCGATLRRTVGRTLALSVACTLVGAAAFVFALVLPLMRLRVAGRLFTATLSTGPEMLARRGSRDLAITVALTLVALPALRLAAMLVVLAAAHTDRPPPWTAWLFGWLEPLRPWAMVEVYLVGVLVASSRLRALADVEVGSALFAVGGAALASIAANASLDRELVWHRLGSWRASGVRDPGGASCLGCATCGLVQSAREGGACLRCRHTLRARKANAPTRAWALTLAAAFLYVPANLLPVIETERFGRGGPRTILGGIRELAADQLWPLAIIVFIASILIPVLKIASLAAMLVMTHRRSGAYLQGRTRLFRLLRVIGRWSMIDIFALTTLVGLVHAGFIATVLPGDGALVFCAVVVLTMLATELFDPRLMWDASVKTRPAACRGTQAG
jgi:paraquat-inducible protein A